MEGQTTHREQGWRAETQKKDRPLEKKIPSVAVDQRGAKANKRQVRNVERKKRKKRDRWKKTNVGGQKGV